MSTKSARAIILREDQILLVHRIRLGSSYWTTPGGHQEPNETLEQTVLREVSEETGVIIKAPRKVFILPKHQDIPEQHYFLCEYVSGEPKLQPHAPEDEYVEPGVNEWVPQWMSQTEVPSLTMFAPPFKAALIVALGEDGFPQQPKVLAVD